MTWARFEMNRRPCEADADLLEPLDLADEVREVEDRAVADDDPLVLAEDAGGDVLECVAPPPIVTVWPAFGPPW
jgi:hypothetical protein